MLMHKTINQSVSGRSRAIVNSIIMQKKLFYINLLTETNVQKYVNLTNHERTSIGLGIKCYDLKNVLEQKQHF